MLNAEQVRSQPRHVRTTTRLGILLQCLVEPYNMGEVPPRIGLIQRTQRLLQIDRANICPATSERSLSLDDHRVKVALTSLGIASLIHIVQLFQDESGHPPRNQRFGFINVVPFGIHAQKLGIVCKGAGTDYPSRLINAFERGKGICAILCPVGTGASSVRKDRRTHSSRNRIARLTQKRGGFVEISDLERLIFVAVQLAGNMAQ